MTATATYTRVHEAFKRYAADRSCSPFAMRIVLCLYENGTQTSAALAKEFRNEGSAVRRAVYELERDDLAVLTDANGRRQRRGQPMYVTLTEDGVRVGAGLREVASA